MNLLVLHLLGEVSNPFLILRSCLKILKKTDTTLYKVNDVIFASVFLFARVLLTPIFVVYMFEAHNVLYSIKLGVSFILYVQLFWAYRILYLIFEKAREPYVKKDKKAPKWVELSFGAMEAVQNNAKVRKAVAFSQFVIIFVVPHVYYGYFTKSLKFNLVF